MRHLSLRWGVSFILATGLVVGLVGCGSQPKETPAPVIAPSAAPLKPPPAPSPQAPMEEQRLSLGILLPLSGSHGAVGQDLLKGAQMALFDLGRSDILLLPQDSGGTVEGAHRAAQKLLDQKADLILGPLLALEVGGVKELARSRGKILMAFTSDKSAVGEGVYSLGFAPDQQIQRIVRYAKGQGFSSLVALLPEGAYGRLVAESLASLKGEMALKNTLYYNNPQDVRASDLGLAPGDALLVVEGGESLNALTQTLRAQGVDPSTLQFLGTGQWDNPLTFANEDLLRGWFAAPDDREWQNFSSRFEALYGHKPARLTSLAYDAVALGAALNPPPSGGETTKDMTALLLNGEGFVGLDGPFTFNGTGMAQRPLEIYEVTRRGPQRRSY